MSDGRRGACTMGGRICTNVVIGEQVQRQWMRE